MTQDVPKLRIVDQESWGAVKRRQQAMAIGPAGETDGNPMLDRRRPSHLFAGLVKCGCCGGGYAKISKDLLGCTTARNKGTCDNRLNIRRDTLEASILNGLRTHLMEPQLFREFCEAFTQEVKRLRIEGHASLESSRVEHARIDRDLDKLMKLILASDDVDASKRVMRQMTELEKRKEELERLLAEANEPPPLLHPNLAALYRQRITALQESLQAVETRAEAAEIIRGLVDRITLMPEAGEL